MASPNDPNKPLGDRSKVEREVGGSTRWGWIWIVIVIIVILVIWFGRFGWGTSGGLFASRHRERLAPTPIANTPAMQAQQPGSGVLAGNGVQILASPHKATLIGQPFQIRNVPVTEKNGDRALWIGADNMEPMLVVLVGNEAAQASARINQGSNVEVSGTVERPPSASIARKQWHLSEAGAKRLEQEGAYIQATILKPSTP